jgi:Flp pilus assembly protein TadG
MMRNFLHLLKQDRRGVAVIELALYAPILALMTIGVVDMSNAFSRKLALEQAAQRSLEKAMQTTGTLTPAETIKKEVSAQANIPAAEVDSKVEVTYQRECDGEIQTEYAGDCPGGEDKALYIIVEVNDTYEPMFPVRFVGLDEDGTYHVQAIAGMRTQ